MAETYSCAVRDGTLRCWGENMFGQLGTGDLDGRLTATVIAPERSWRAVVTGDNHACAIADTGDVYCWGDNARGQLGLGDQSPRLVPTQVALPPAVALSAREANTCAVLSDGAMQCWGSNGEGQLGIDTTVDSLVPVAPMSDLTWSQVSSGQAHTLAIATDGSLWGTGRNTSNELALTVPFPGQTRILRAAVGGPWAQATVGQNQSCGIDASERMYCWGANSSGVLGVGDVAPRDAPTEIGATIGWREVWTHTFASCAIDTGGRLWCWGRNVEGQLGTGDNMDRLAPVDVSQGFTDWVDIAVGRFHACALRADGSAWCTGSNGGGELGTGTTMRRNTFSLVAF